VITHCDVRNVTRRTTRVAVLLFHPPVPMVHFPEAPPECPLHRNIL
jgi:hypothetical protein